MILRLDNTNFNFNRLLNFII